jgi:hypothetical protein
MDLYKYTYKNGKFYMDLGDSLHCHDSVSIVYEEGEEFDVLLKHGDSEGVKMYFEKCSKFHSAGMPMKIVLVKVSPDDIDLLNKCISTSATKNCRALCRKSMDKQGGE